MIGLNNKLRVQYSEVDVDTASRKLNEAALNFEGNSTSVEFADIGSHLAPLEFKIFFEKTFAVKLTTPEVRGHSCGTAMCSFSFFSLYR